jgi:hypothetical protein
MDLDRWMIVVLVTMGACIVVSFVVERLYVSWTAAPPPKMEKRKVQKITPPPKIERKVDTVDELDLQDLPDFGDLFTEE